MVSLERSSALTVCNQSFSFDLGVIGARDVVVSGSDADADVVVAVPNPCVLKVRQNRPFHSSRKAKAVVIKQSRIQKVDMLQ